MQLEVEQKYLLTQPEQVAACLDTLGVQWQPPIQQSDIYFNHPIRDYAQTDEALRLRSVAEQNCITYKGPKLSATTKTRQELEIPLVAGLVHLEQYCELLTALGFRRVREVCKERRPGTVEWQGQSIEIAWDQVAGLGTYIELELCVEPENLATAQAMILSLATKLGLTEPERRSYLEMLETKS
jgi:adenylate cyclase, class 2